MRLIASTVPVGLVEIPCFIKRGAINVKRESIGRILGGNKLAVQLLVESGEQPSVFVEAITNQIIFQYRGFRVLFLSGFRFSLPVTCRKPECRDRKLRSIPSIPLPLNGNRSHAILRQSRPVPVFRQLDKTAISRVQRIEKRYGTFLPGQEPGGGLFLQTLQRGVCIGMLARGIFINLMNRGAGKNIMKLIQQQNLPNPVKFFRRICFHRKRTPQHFGGGDHFLQFPIVSFDAALTG